MSKTYEPHVIIVWDPNGRSAHKEFPYKEDALEKYMELEALHVPKIILAKVVRQHGEG